MWANGREAASWQAYATGARMNARVVWLWLRLSIFLWTVSTLMLVWFWTGRYFPAFGHRDFPEWFAAWILSELRLPLIHPTLPYMGRRYPAEVMYVFLNGKHFYQHSFGKWFLHYAPYGALGPVLGSLIFWSIRRRLRGGPQHLRGPELLDPAALNNSLNTPRQGRVMRFAAWLALQREPAEPAPVMIGRVKVPHQYETQHFMITGSPGGGKSTVIRHILRQLAVRGDLVAVADPECEYVQEFYNPERGDMVLNPLDSRCPAWSPWSEIRPDFFGPDAAAMAATFVPEQPNIFAENSAAIFFRRSSRTLIEAILERIEPRDASAALRLLAQPRDRIKEMLAGTPAEPLIDPGAHEQGSGIVATTANAIRPLEYLPALEPGRPSWSARQWAEEPRGWLFLCSTEDSRDATLQLQAVWLDTLVRWLMAAEIGARNRPRVWIVADELSVLRFQPQLENLVTRGRKRGLCAVLGFQNISQLRSIYGRDRADTLAASPTTKLIMRCDEAGTAGWASEQIGRREVIRMDMTTLTGLSNYREGFNLQPRQNVESLVLPGEVQMLKPFEAYLCMAGHNRAKVRIDFAPLVSRQPAFIPRAFGDKRSVITAPPEMESPPSQAKAQSGASRPAKHWS
ncbi:MAG: type IV secretion system DNA-binding domain-containing protein [Candidatus Binataceae bacterium]